MWFLLIFLAVPILEIALFIQVGGLIGLWPTLGLVILTAVAGLTLMRAQGLNALNRLQTRVAAGDDPSGPIADAAMILVAGVLLLIPGFFTDALGLVLLIPAARAVLLRRAAGRLRTRSFDLHPRGARRGATSGRRHDRGRLRGARRRAPLAARRLGLDARRPVLKRAAWRVVGAPRPC